MTFDSANLNGSQDFGTVSPSSDLWSKGNGQVVPQPPKKPKRPKGGKGGKGGGGNGGGGGTAAAVAAAAVAAAAGERPRTPA